MTRKDTNMTDDEWMDYWTAINPRQAAELSEMADQLCNRINCTRREFITEREAGSLNFRRELN
jgi:hypothetical protein